MKFVFKFKKKFLKSIESKNWKEIRFFIYNTKNWNNRSTWNNKFSFTNTFWWFTFNKYKITNSTWSILWNRVFHSKKQKKLIHFKINSGKSQTKIEGGEHNWITVFGFTPKQTSFVLKQFGLYGEILDHKIGNGNWMHIK